MNSQKAKGEMTGTGAAGDFKQERSQKSRTVRYRARQRWFWEHREVIQDD